MPALETDDVFSPRYLSPNPGGSSLLKSPSRQSLSLNPRKSSASLRSSSLADSLAVAEDDGVNGRHSLAHELAAALLPEPSAGSKLLAEEFGIEYDEGAEGIDGVPAGTYDDPVASPHPRYEDIGGATADSLAAQLNGASPHSPAHDLDFRGSPHPTVPGLEVGDAPQDLDPDFRSPVASPTKPRRQPEQDPMAILAADLEYTEKFLAQLRRLDAGDQPPSATGPAPVTLERIASDVIRRINDATRDREGQVRELLEYEREFRKISADPGGNDALAHLPELEDIVKDDVQTPGPSSARAAGAGAGTGRGEVVDMDTVVEEANDWEVDPDQRSRLGDEDEEDEYGGRYSPQVTPIKAEFPVPPTLSGPPTPAAAIPLLAHLRTFTTSTATSLATISEHTQVNAAATTEAGRKIRALKNKLGGWRTEWDSAERSRIRIEKWEAGIVDGDTPTSAAGATSPPRVQRRIDGRKIVQEHLKAFEEALREANEKTQAIIAAVS
ncbi:hypothetical protein BD309DRAFT_998274 [Dichomitus squalens]|uniref:Uncharacterized protein n=2 Tax=Dichomitus squalens TaxID=114155 RepID=A0A4Q9N0Z7_9APHY|nr:uncharacterized protein DICSQDRAFT_65701 [Dichomitus squalens LYAD-421 SS1]EJF59028.1 hypothetical protein DICSQDRAFT_65701 [Dichomitus squalens LYAD-421 SS1]TBU34119.1 hypothetical protein BD311DRAFT_683354 [Dichomitus squalens]TBU47591.1 hypothetical protein BD309DRAFT_998274 [Dichomitus squalens]TBU57752.1 hypothetical protein BD310DRAFT_880275 [Dichomitus squalens]